MEKLLNQKTMGRNIFNSVKMTKPKKNRFDLSHDVKLSLDMGNLVPICVLPAIPGDKFHLGCETLVRFAPLVSPVMHRFNVFIHYFFCPWRIVWPNFELYITNTPNPTVLPAWPTTNISSANYTDLDDYLGIPPPIGAESETISAMAHACYQKIYNEYYRDQNLITKVDDVLNDGNNVGTSLKPLRKRAWEHDYFTASLPFAQKGAAISLPLGTFPDVRVNRNSASGTTTITATPSNITVPQLAPPVNTSAQPIPTDALYAQTSLLTAAAATINDLRRAFRLQEWLEKAARGGSRYTENIYVHFGVKSPDARLQRPEYICGSVSPVVISEVLNTTGTTELPQGNMSGHAVSVNSGRTGSYYVQEHGYIMGIMSVMPKTAYMQGLPKHLTKTTDPFEHFWPSFANIGEQPVLNKEIYAFQGATGANTFGYVPRYAEYKYEPSRVAGEFRTTLDFWHLARKFATPPALNQAFVECNSDDLTRIFAVEDPAEQKLYAHVLNRITAIRGMPKFGTPTI